MLKQKNIFGIAILLILIVNFGFILAQEIEIKNEIVSFDSEKVDYTISEDGKEIKLEFTDGGFVEIKGNKFENILPESQSLNPSYIKMDNLGNIFEADLTANEKGSTFLINGLTVKAPPDSRVYYDKNGFYVEGKREGVEVTNINKEQFADTPINGKNINFFNELFLNSGTAYIKETGYVLEDRASFVYDKMEITQKGLNKILIEKNPLKDLSSYKENFIQHTKNGLKIKSAPDALSFNLRFLEGNEIFDIPPQEGNEESLLSMDISDGDELELFKKDYLIKGMPPLIKHKSRGHDERTITTRGGKRLGQTIIKNGRHIFKFEDGKYLSELGNLNTKNKLSTEFNLESDLLKDKAINIDDNNRYLIYEPKTGKNIFTFDKTLLNSPNYNFESEIGKKMYSFAEDQVGNSAFVWGGRGNVFYDEKEGEIRKKIPTECGVKAYDCIGLPLTFLPKIYPENSLKDFPPNLQLVKTLEEKGWSSSVVEPSKVVGEKTAEDSVKNIPPGSIVFLMHNFGSEYSETLEGKSQQKYLNSKGEDIIITLGHTLIRGTGKKNFINAYPNTPEEELPKLAREYNEYLRKQGKDPFFEGTVREAEMVPQEDYFVVMSPPKT